MRKIDSSKLPLELQKIKTIKKWYLASEYNSRLFLEAYGLIFCDWQKYEEWASKEPGGKDPAATWLYGTTKEQFYPPTAEELLAEGIDEAVFDGAWELVKKEFEAELIIIEAAIIVLADKMKKQGIVEYVPDYQTGIVSDKALDVL